MEQKFFCAAKRNQWQKNGYEEKETKVCETDTNEDLMAE